MRNGTQLIKIAATWLLIFMLGLAACIVTITVVNGKSFGPESTVSSYLSALREGNGAKALGLLRAKVPDANAAALNGDALARSQQKLENVSVGAAVDVQDGHKKVTVSYSVAGEAFTTDFLLAPGPRQWLFFNSWEMVPGTLPVVNVSVVNANESSVNGAPANMPDGRNSFAAFYPGSYEFEYRSTLFAAPPVTRIVTGSGVPLPAVSLATGPTSDLLTQVDGTIRKYLDGCTAQAVLMPTGCPMSAVTNNRVTSPIIWSIVQYPAITISPFGGQWVLSPLSVKAQVQYDEQDLFTGLIAPVKDTHDFGFTAKLSISGTTVTVTPVVSY